jgi:hypothetical protein
MDLLVLSPRAFPPSHAPGSHRARHAELSQRRRGHDIRGKQQQLPDIYDRDSYESSHKLGRALKLTGSNGIVYDGVRHPGDECLAIYRPRLIQSLRQGVHLRDLWDGEHITEVYELRLIDQS